MNPTIVTIVILAGIAAHLIIRGEDSGDGDGE